MTESETFVASAVESQLQPGEEITNIGYLLGSLRVSGAGNIGRGISSFVAAAKQQACFVALTGSRAFFLWSKPGRVGAFSPLLEFEEQTIYERGAVRARLERQGLFGKKLAVSLGDGEQAEFALKRKAKGFPNQARLVDELLGPT